MNRDRLHATTKKSALVRLKTNHYATVLAIYKSADTDMMEERPFSYRYRATRSALLKDPEAANSRAAAATLLPEYVRVPKQPAIYVKICCHEIVDIAKNPFLIRYPAGEEHWIMATEIESQVALALVSHTEQTATACPPRDPYVHYSVAASVVVGATSHFLRRLPQNCAVRSKCKRTPMRRPCSHCPTPCGVPGMIAILYCAQIDC